MIVKVYNNESDTVETGDVLFAVFKPGTVFERLPLQHAALYISEEPIQIATPNQTIPLAEVVTHPTLSYWPNTQNDYRVNLIGKMESEEFGQEKRNKIRLVAMNVIDFADISLKIYGKKKCCSSIVRYKYAPKLNDITEELHFSCSGFVEYCYEQAEVDIIKDDPQCTEVHNDLRTSCAKSPLPLDHESLVHRLFPGYLIHAFAENKYNLDVSDSYSLRYYQHS